MFIVSSKIVKGIIEGRIDYNGLPYDKENEIVKGYKFEEQAKVNLSLCVKYNPVCLTTGKPCGKDDCVLFTHKSGKVLKGWACKEYQIDFPRAPFDQRYHVTFIGNDKIDAKETNKHLLDLKKEERKSFVSVVRGFMKISRLCPTMTGTEVEIILKCVHVEVISLCLWASLLIN